MTMTNIKLIKQPTGNSCGPTCLAMVYEYVNTLKGIRKKTYRQYVNSETDVLTVTDEVDVEQETLLNANLVGSIANACGTDWEVGTPPDRMEKGMKVLELNYIEYSHMKNPYKLLQTVLDSKNIAILRTITKGVPHWVIVYGINFIYPEKFKVLDPWQGEIEYTQEELELIWKQRDYQFFEIQIPTQSYYL